MQVIGPDTSIIFEIRYIRHMLPD